MTFKTIVVLANSSKKGGRCLAGKEVQMSGNDVLGFGPWIRPISAGQVELPGNSEGGQVTEHTMRQCLNRPSLPGILEILEIPFARAAGLADQPENWEVAEGEPWRSLGKCPRELLPQMVDRPARLWDTSGKGWAKVGESLPKEPGFASLYLIEPQGRLSVELGYRHKRSGSSEQVQYQNLCVPYGGMTHEFRISDPAFNPDSVGGFPEPGPLPKFSELPAGTLVTVSLTPPYRAPGQITRYHYKMAAAIIGPANA